ncbi:hypothetical protein DSECCO2_302500 [anaerobic digester metagenome]
MVLHRGDAGPLRVIVEILGGTRVDHDDVGVPGKDLLSRDLVEAGVETLLLALGGDRAGDIDAAGSLDPFVHVGIPTVGDQVGRIVALEDLEALVRRDVPGPVLDEADRRVEVRSKVFGFIGPVEELTEEEDLVLGVVEGTVCIRHEVDNRDASLLLDDRTVDIARDDELGVAREEFLDVDLPVLRPRRGKVLERGIDLNEELGLVSLGHRDEGVLNTEHERDHADRSSEDPHAVRRCRDCDLVAVHVRDGPGLVQGRGSRGVRA